MTHCIQCTALNLRRVTRQQVLAFHYWCDRRGGVEASCIGRSDCEEFERASDDVVAKRQTWLAKLK